MVVEYEKENFLHKFGNIFLRFSSRPLVVAHHRKVTRQELTGALDGGAMSTFLDPFSADHLPFPLMAAQEMRHINLCMWAHLMCLLREICGRTFFVRSPDLVLAPQAQTW